MDYLLTVQIPQEYGIMADILKHLISNECKNKKKEDEWIWGQITITLDNKGIDTNNIWYNLPGSGCAECSRLHKKLNPSMYSFEELTGASKGTFYRIVHENNDCIPVYFDCLELANEYLDDILNRDRDYIIQKISIFRK